MIKNKYGFIPSFKGLLVLFLFGMLVLPGKTVKAAEYSSKDSQPYSWEYNLSSYVRTVPSSGKYTDTGFGSEIEEGAALYLGVGVGDPEYYFEPDLKTPAYVSSMQLLSASGKRDLSDQPAMIMKNVEPFMYRNSDTYLTRGVLFDLYYTTEDKSEEIGCSKDYSFMHVLTPDQLMPGGSYSADFKKKCFDKLHKDGTNDWLGFYSVGTGLGMPSDYSFALLDRLPMEKDFYGMVPVIGKVTRDINGSVVDFKPLAQFSVFTMEDSQFKPFGLNAFCSWAALETFYGDATDFYYFSVSDSVNYWRAPFTDIIEGKYPLIIKASHKVAPLTDIKGTYTITGDTEISTNLILENETQLVVKSGATLSLTGMIINRGLIKVEKGARLIIGGGAGIQTEDPYYGTAVTTFGNTYCGRIESAGDIVVLNGGFLIVPGIIWQRMGSIEERSGYIPMNNTAALCCSGGNLIIAGTVCTGVELEINNTHVQLEESGVLLNGCVYNKPFNQADLDRFLETWKTQKNKLGDTTKFISNLNKYRDAVQQVYTQMYMLNLDWDEISVESRVAEIMEADRQTEAYETVVEQLRLFRNSSPSLSGRAADIASFYAEGATVENRGFFLSLTRTHPGKYADYQFN